MPWSGTPAAGPRSAAGRRPWRSGMGPRRRPASPTPWQRDQPGSRSRSRHPAGCRCRDHPAGTARRSCGGCRRSAPGTSAGTPPTRLGWRSRVGSCLRKSRPCRRCSGSAHGQAPRRAAAPDAGRGCRTPGRAGECARLRAKGCPKSHLRCHCTPATVRRTRAQPPSQPPQSAPADGQRHCEPASARQSRVARAGFWSCTPCIAASQAFPAPTDSGTADQSGQTHNLRRASARQPG